ncbi:MAG: RNA methyltransferase [Vulcanimicrobiota bacterium]
MINLENITVILDETINAGNLGAIARVMRNFGLKDLILINPRCDFNEEAYARARHAAWVLEQAKICKSLDEASPQFNLILGTSRRGAQRLHMRMSPRLSAQEIDKRYSDARIGLLFGNEKSGLTNEDLEKCAWYITIPTHPSFESLNLSHSVAVILYEIACLSKFGQNQLYKEPAEDVKIDHLFDHMVSFLKTVGFPVRNSPQRVYSDLKRLISSADVRRTDVNLIHGLMRYLEEKYLGGWIEDDIGNKKKQAEKDKPA